MPGRSSYDYAILRVMPDVERGERVNVGVILICHQRRFLGMRVGLDQARVLALAPDLDLALVRDYLAGLERICAGDTQAGPIAALSQAERFHWLVAPASGAIQPSPVHTGLCARPETTLNSLFARLVLPSGVRGPETPQHAQRAD
ncbi:MAG: DUF3037 domain-containing protein [Ktedonobacterales bacterium]